MALTRAKNTEYILAYGSLVNPKIVADYEQVIADLVQAGKIEALRASGTNPDILSDEEVESALAMLEQQAREAYEAGDTDVAMELIAPDLKFSTTGEELPDDVIAELAEEAQAEEDAKRLRRNS